MLDSTLSQITAISVDPNRALIISDADEVLLTFMSQFENFLTTRGYYFDWSSFRLTGNVHRTDDTVSYTNLRAHETPDHRGFRVGM